MSDWKKIDLACEDSHADNYDSLYVNRTYFTRAEYDGFAKFTNKYAKDNMKVLDLGCGTGPLVSKIKGSIFGLDFSAALLKRANPSGVYIRGDGEYLPFRDRSFDLVYAHSFFHHFPDYEKLVSEIKRVLRSEGIVICDEPKVNALHLGWLRLYLAFLRRLHLSLYEDVSALDSTPQTNHHGDLNPEIILGCFKRYGFMIREIKNIFYVSYFTGVFRSRIVHNISEHVLDPLLIWIRRDSQRVRFSAQVT